MPPSTQIGEQIIDLNEGFRSDELLVVKAPPAAKGRPQIPRTPPRAASTPVPSVRPSITKAKSPRPPSHPPPGMAAASGAYVDDVRPSKAPHATDVVPKDAHVPKFVPPPAAKASASSRVVPTPPAPPVHESTTTFPPPMPVKRAKIVNGTPVGYWHYGSDGNWVYVGETIVFW